jgi:hypothetical protein
VGDPPAFQKSSLSPFPSLSLRAHPKPDRSCAT